MGLLALNKMLRVSWLVICGCGPKIFHWHVIVKNPCFNKTRNHSFFNIYLYYYCLDLLVKAGFISLRFYFFSFFYCKLLDIPKSAWTLKKKEVLVTFSSFHCSFLEICVSCMLTAIRVWYGIALLVVAFGSSVLAKMKKLLLGTFTSPIVRISRKVF